MPHGGTKRIRKKREMRELQTAGALDGIGDVADGITDFTGGLYDTAAGAGDFILGDIDESVGRTFDDEAGGGVFDGIANTADNLFGSTDEAFARTFDDKPGGGLVGGVKNVLPIIQQRAEVRQRQVEEGILPEGSGEPKDVQASGASVKKTDTSAPPNGTAVQLIRVRNGLANVSKKNPNRRETEKQDVISPEGAALGIGAAAAGVGTAAAAGASVGAVAGPPGVAIGAVAAGAGSLLAAATEEFVGALGYTVTGFIDGEPVGQTVTSVGVPPAGVGKNGKNVELQHKVPEKTGDYTLRVVVSMWQTGDVVQTMEVPISVEEGEKSQTSNDSPDDGGGDDSGGDSGIVEFAKNNPGLAAVGGIGSLVAINSFSGSLGEGLAE